ncbi:MAG: pilin [Candidatus Saccharimonadales bacterium]
MNKLKLLFSTLVVAFSLLVAPVVVTGVSLAVYTSPGDSAAAGACGDPTNATSASCQSNANQNTLPTIIGKIISIFSWVVGAVSVIMLIYGGFKYITSGGDSGGVTAAKNTILYAIVGLVIVALSQVIVNFVLDKANNATSATGSTLVVRK